MEENKKISVSIITYNHEKFIEKCLQGVIDQRLPAGWDYEILIGEDKSTDGTLRICEKFESKYPQIVRILRRSKNLGMTQNWRSTIQECKGRYIAICEGDDYWTDSLKLQKQVDFLEENLHYSGCFTNALILDEVNGKPEKRYIEHTKDKTYSLKEVVRSGGGFFPTASLLFRNKLGELPSFFLDVKSADRALALLLSNLGEIYLLNEITCVYRKHDSGIFTSIENDDSKRLEIDLSNMDLLRKINEFTNRKHERIINIILSNYSQRILVKYPKELTNPLRSRLKDNLLFIDKIRLFKNSTLVPR